MNKHDVAIGYYPDDSAIPNRTVTFDITHEDIGLELVTVHQHNISGSECIIFIVKTGSSLLLKFYSLFRTRSTKYPIHVVVVNTSTGEVHDEELDIEQDDDLPLP